MLFAPKWYKELPSNIKPSVDKVKKLEEIRKTFDIPHDVLALQIAGSNSTTRKIQANLLEQYRENFPQAHEKELLIMVLMSRLEAMVTQGHEIPSEEDFKQAISSVNSFKDLCDYIISLNDFDPTRIDKKVIVRCLENISAGKKVSFPKIPEGGISKLIDEILES